MRFSFTNRLNILAADDEDELLMLLERSLTGKGYTVRTSLNGYLFWEMVRQAPPDVIFLDVQMKGINGADMCRQLKTDPITAAIPVIMLSASFNTPELAQACGADGFVQKPYSTDKILKEITRVLPNIVHKKQQATGN